MMLLARDEQARFILIGVRDEEARQP